MAGGNIQPGTSAPEQTQPTYGPQMQPMYQQPYMPPRVPADYGAMMKKTFLIILLGIGALLMFVGRLVGIYAGDLNILKLGHALWTFGGFMIAVPSFMWALGSKRTTDMQNLGLLLLAAIVVAAMTSWLTFSFTWP